MKSHFNYIIHRFLFWNRHTLLLSFPIILIFIGACSAYNYHSHTFSSSLNYKLVFPFVMILIGLVFIAKFYLFDAKGMVEKFNNLKYSNFPMKTFKFLKHNEQKLFFKHIVQSIKKRDLNFDKLAERLKNSPKSHRILITELNSISFRQSLLSELTYERFEVEIMNRCKKSEWIRDLLNYKGLVERAFFITSTHASDSAMLNSMNELKKAIETNINITDQGVELNSKGLKDNIAAINDRVSEINLRYRIILNPLITQKQFAKIIETYSSEYLPGFKANRFSAYYTGYLTYDSSKYNRQNIFTRYWMDLNNNEIKLFIALIRYLKKKDVIMNDDSLNSALKMADIIELFVENCMMSSETIRRNFSKEFRHKKELDAETMTQINSTIVKYLPRN